MQKYQQGFPLMPSPPPQELHAHAVAALTLASCAHDEHDETSLLNLVKYDIYIDGSHYDNPLDGK